MTDSWRQDAPFLAVAALLHALVLAGNPSLPWASAKPAQRTIPVEFVPMPSMPPEPPVPGDGSAKAPGHGAGQARREMRGSAPKAKKRPAARPVDPAAAAKRREALQRRAMSLALARAAQADAARAKAEAAAAAKAEAARAAAEAAQRKAREAAERRMARARKQADIARALAVLPAPDERIEETPDGAGARAASAKALLDSEAAAPDVGDDAPAYAEDAARRTGKDAYAAPASGGGFGQGGGDASFTLEGPVGSRRLVSRVLPESPAWVAQRALDLAVQIRFQVLADGSVKAGAVIAKTSGFPDLDRRALEAIKKWRFAAQAGASPVWGMVSFRFTY